jgi:hypothetical protein
MDLYPFALFLHIVGALALFAALAIESVGLTRLRAATTVGAALPWLGVTGLPRRFFPWILAAILIPGIWMVIVNWGPVAWPMLALGGVVVMAGLGMIVSGGVMRKVGPAVGALASQPATPAPESIRNPLLVRSLLVRVGIGLGIVALMVFKPDAITSTVILVAGAALGGLASIGVVRR